MRSESRLSARTRSLAGLVKRQLRALPLAPLGSYSLQVIEIEGARRDASGLMVLQWMDGPSTSEAMRALCVPAPGVVDAAGEEDEVLLAQLMSYERSLSFGAAAALSVHSGERVDQWSVQQQERASLVDVPSAAEHVRILHELAAPELKAQLPRGAQHLAQTRLSDLDAQIAARLLGDELRVAADLLAE